MQTLPWAHFSAACTLSELKCWDLGTDFHLGMYWSLSAPHVWSCASVAAAASCPEVSVDVNMCSTLLKASDLWAEYGIITF